MMKSDINAIIEILDQRTEPVSLFPSKTWNPSLEPRIEALNEWGSSTEIITIIAALHLRNESLSLSHSYAQQIEHDMTGAYWHGIMHRMESDYSNARYWFWQASRHPVMQQVQQRVSEWLQQHWRGQVNELRSNTILQSFQHGGWSSEQFIEVVKLSSTLDNEAKQLLTMIQAIEMDALFQYSLEALST